MMKSLCILILILKNGFISDNKRSKYLTLIPADENKHDIKKDKGAWNKINYFNKNND